MKNLLCFSHLDWNLVYQRPQHLLTRFSSQYNIYYFEEPKRAQQNYLTDELVGGICVIRLFSTDPSDNGITTTMIHDYLSKKKISADIAWYYTPMAMNFTQNINAGITVFDSMDELSAFKFAPPELLSKEEELFRKADIVFTGGHSLFEAKKHRHHNIHCFPSSIDKAHFYQARDSGNDPEDQHDIPFPRFGFYGVLDERFNTELLKAVAELRPEWSFVIIGPVVKISEDDLPKAGNIFYLGSKNYSELPHYIRHWDVAMNMFALNDATRYISPTKTPEYLSAGLPVISTSIADVVKPYGAMQLVDIADDAGTFVNLAEEILYHRNRTEWLKNVDQFLADKSWDRTQKEMETLINKLN